MVGGMDVNRFDGAVALVTGGASGIGAATARRLAAEGARVAIVDIDETAAKELAVVIDGIGVYVDVTDTDSVRDAVASVVTALGPIDILVNNAGGDRIALFCDTDVADWDAGLALNLRGTMACTHAVLGTMCDRRTGAIINVASEAGRTGIASGAVYSAAKAGVLGFTKAIAREAAPFGVRCNAVAPGPVDTPLLQHTAEAAGRLGARVKQMMVDATLFRRAGQPDEIAAAIAYLASSDASFVTGETLAVSGGISMW
jgi:2-hydroxycyclohexanecarboxyl-CoA dehydrogenase